MKRAFLEHRPALLAFLIRMGAGDAAEDVLQDLWMHLPADDAGIRAPRSYLFRMAHSLVIDRERSRRQATRRDAVWLNATGPAIPERSEAPSADRIIEARQAAVLAFDAVAREGERVARIFRRHRIDGLTQREVAAELGVSIGTVEGDLRRAYAALRAFRHEYDEG
jgi:RNA polymerase sigma factor (sigma-70 family)